MQNYLEIVIFPFIKKAISWLVLLVFAVELHAQADNPLFRRISQQNGLSNSRVTCFLKDRKGYVWVGTSLGLNRYDGLQFEKFMHNSYNPASLSWNVITALEEDKDGNIWIGTEAGGLNMYNPTTKKFTHYRARKNDSTTIADDHIKSLKADDQNNIWIGYNFEGWSILNLKTKQFIHEKSKLTFINHWGENAANCVTGFAHDVKGSTWITTTYGLVHKNNTTGAITTFTDNMGKYYIHNENLFIKPVLMGDTAVALTTWGCGIKFFDIKSKTFKSNLFDKQYNVGAFTNIILDISHKKNDEFWVASADKGLGIFNAHTKAFTFFSHNPNDDYTPPPKECRVVYNDRDGMLWAGFDYGLCYWTASLQNFTTTTFSDFTGPVKDNVSVLATCYQQNLNSVFYSRLFGKGLYEKQEQTGKITCHLFPNTFTREDGTIFIRSITPLQNNKLLLQTSTGWFTFNTLSKKIEKATINYSGNLLEPVGYSSKPDKEGYAWFTDKKQNAYRINMNTLKVVMPKEGLVLKYPLPSYSFIAGVINKQQNWIADRNLGLCILHTETNRMDTAYLQKGLTRISDAKAMAADNQNHFWITTFSSGLYEMWQTDNGKYTYRHYTESEGFPEMFLSHVVIDSTQHLWIASKSGIIVCNTKNRSFKLFTISDGYDVEWSEINELNLHPTGNLFISHQKGYSKLNVYNFEKNKKPPPVIITSFKVNAKEWIDSFSANPLKVLDLKYNQNFLGFSFIALNYIDASQNQYAFKLDGVDKAWVNSKSRAEITYSDLKPGNYSFSLKAANNDGVWNENPATIRFSIQPPFWKEVWFIAMMVLLFSFMVYKFYIYKINLVRKEERIKAEFNKKVAEAEVKALRAQMNPHFIFNCMNTLDSFILQKKQMEASQLVQRFSKLTRRVLEHTTHTYIALADEIETLRIYLQIERMRQADSFEFDINIAPETAQLPIPPMLIQPFVENAVIHGMRNRNAPGGMTHIFSQLEGSQIKITVQDNGVGRAKAMEIKAAQTVIHQSISMELTLSRLEALHGHKNHGSYLVFTNRTEPQTGTIVEIFIPVVKEMSENKS